MTLKEFCINLKLCADKLEEEIKYNINDVHNLVYSNQLNETKMALEKAKDYHYSEIMDSIAEILKNIKKILFHQDKIQWLSDEGNFSKDELRRFSYVKRQVFAFSNNDVPTPPSPIIPSPNIKKEKRRTASEVSIGTLEAWEKYLDHKDIEEKEMEEKVAELKPLISKRTLSNARRRKKFVSSTMGGFLEGDGRSRNLDSILEDGSSTEDNDRLSYSQSLESLDNMILGEEQVISHNDVPLGSEVIISDNYSESLSVHGSMIGSLESLHIMACDNDMGGSSNNISQSSENVKEVEDTTDSKEHKKITKGSQSGNKLAIGVEIDSQIMNIIKENTPTDEESVKNEIIYTFFNDVPILADADAKKTKTEKIKPKVIDVILKKKPT